MINIEGVSKIFGTCKVLDDISIHIKPGTIHGIIGENGAGKTTLLQCLAGIYEIDEGNILIHQQSVWENQRLKEDIGYVADRNQFFKNYRVKELVHFFEMMYTKFSREDFNTYNKIFQISPQSKVKQLSKGMQMRLSFMLHLAFHPKVLILDEPTSGLDAIIKKALLDLIIEEVEARGTTVVISSHHLSELEKLCDEMTILKEGKVTYRSSVDELKSKIKKLQIVFKEQPPVDLEKWQEFLKVERVGNVYYGITKDYDETIEEKLREHGAFMLTTIGLTLEEIFIYASTKGEDTDEQIQSTY